MEDKMLKTREDIKKIQRLLADYDKCKNLLASLNLASHVSAAFYGYTGTSAGSLNTFHTPFKDEKLANRLISVCVDHYEQKLIKIDDALVELGVEADKNIGPNFS